MSDLLYLVKSSRIVKQQDVVMPVPLECSTATKECTVLVSCPPRARLPARNGLVNEVEFLGLIPQNGGRPTRLRDR